MPRIAMIVPFIQIIGRFSVRYRVLHKTTLLYKIVKPSVENDDDRSAKVNRRHWFWRVLALEEFTDVQCVIVDHPMPSLAGDRGSSKDHRPSNRFPSVTPSGFSEIFINQCHSRFRLEIYRGSTTKDVIWFSSGPYDSRNMV